MRNSKSKQPGDAFGISLIVTYLSLKNPTNRKWNSFKPITVRRHYPSFQRRTDSRYYPYDSKVMAYLDILDNFPRHKVSSQIMGFVITMLSDCGVQGVPSLKALRNKQKELVDRHGIHQHRFEYPGDKELFVNDPRDIIAADWENPKVRPHMQLYPEHFPKQGKVVTSHIWHGSRWTQLPEFLPPMAVHPDTRKRFYV